MEKTLRSIFARLSEYNQGDYWFETRNYLFWKPTSKIGKLLIYGFIALLIWIAIGDIMIGSFGTVIFAIPSLTIVFYVLCFLKGKRV